MPHLKFTSHSFDTLCQTKFLFVGLHEHEHSKEKCNNANYLHAEKVKISLNNYTVMQLNLGFHIKQRSHGKISSKVIWYISTHTTACNSKFNFLTFI